MTPKMVVIQALQRKLPSEMFLTATSVEPRGEPHVKSFAYHHLFHAQRLEGINKRKHWRHEPW